MELFGIVLSFPASLIAVSIYSLILRRITARRPSLSRLILWVSLSVLLLLVLEFIGVTMMGALQLRASLGATYWVAHIVLFFLAVRSLTNMLHLQKKVPFISRWYITAFICAVFTIFVVLLQIVVSEALYGIDGTGGPYS
jgi:hypothetical protein